MTEFVKQQSVILFRIIFTVIVLGVTKQMWDMNNTLIKVSHSMETIVEKLEDINKNTTAIASNKDDIRENKTAIAVHEVRINKLEDDHD